MKKVFAAVAFVVFLSGAAVGWADETTEKVKEWGEFGLGLVAGFTAHEAGHQIVAWGYGDQINWSFNKNGQVLSWFANIRNGEHLRNIALGGTLAEIISSEALLYSAARKDSPFVIGWLSWNIINPFLYVLCHELGGGYQDLETIQKNEHGLNVRWVEAVKVGHALFTAYRLWNNPQFQESKIRYYIGPSRDGIMAGIQYRW